jgi:cell division septation protein DedD
MSVEPQSVILPEGLRAAIACLDLSLESELTLYRRDQSQKSMALVLMPSAESEDSELVLEEFSATDSSELLSHEVRGATELSEQSEVGVDQRATIAEAEEDSDRLPESYSAELMAQPEALDQFLDPSIADYLESSEALLKHLDEPEKADLTPGQDAAKPAQRSWFVVSGITLIVLGIVGLAGFFVMLAVRWFSKPSYAPAPQSLVSPSPQSTVAGSPLPSPAIATESIPTNPTSPPAQTPVGAARVTSTPVPSISPTPPINPNAARYIVLAVANSSETLQDAQRFVPDAYVAEVDGQKRVQLASLDSLQQAQQMVSELKNQGFPASIVAQN